MSALRSGEIAYDIDPEQECFSNFFECWLAEQDRYLHDLINAAREPNTGNEEEEEERHRPLINRVLLHYEYYYQTKSTSAKHNVLAILSPTWTSTLEDAFLWIGGWRPSTTFHLLYSKSGLQLEAQLTEFLRGINTGDLGDLSASQLVQVDELQRRTIREEKSISEKLAKTQETVADPTMVELSHMMTERREEGREEQMETALGRKKVGLEEVLGKADDLRLRTLKGVIEILKPIQAVHFLIAAAELHLRLHEWGKRMDGVTRNHH